MGILSIILGLYFIVSAWLTSIMFKEPTKSDTFLQFLFCLLICPIALLYEMYNDYIE